MRRSQLKLAAIGFVFYTLIAGLFGVQRWAVTAAQGRPTDVNGLLLTFGGIYTWAALTPLVFAIARRWPLGRLGRPANAVAHLAALVLILPIDVGIYAVLDHALLHAVQWGPEPPSLAGKFLRMLTWSAAAEVLWYGGVVAVAHALLYRNLLREREVAANRLQARLAEARLQVLRVQLQPHFLYNTLHAITALVREDPAGARRMTGRLRELLRRTLDEGARQEVTLREELELLDGYLEIQQTRFQERLRVHRDVAPEALEARVPSFILQPLVENALRHGLGRRAAPGRLEIVARRRDGTLAVEVRDDGLGLPAGAGAVREGLGLANTRARLRQLYGSAHRFELRNGEHGGATAELVIPFRPDDGGERP